MNRRSFCLLVALLVVAGACADAPTATSAGSTVPPPDSPLETIEEELAGLDTAARASRLAELSAAETGPFTLYTSMTIDDTEATVDEFNKRYDLDVEFFRANSDKVLQRTLQESEAGFHGADVILTGALEMEILAEENILVALNSPATTGIVPEAVYANWAGVYIQTFVATWNTDELVDANPPTTWEEVLTRYGDGLAMELGDFDWFATLVQHHFMAELGLSEDDAVDLFRQAASSATIVDGHTLMAELLSAGEYDIAASAYQARVGRLVLEGAPVAWEPPVQPLVIRPNGVGVHRETDRPATALLFTEFLLTDAQPILATLGRTPSRMGIAGGINPAYDVLAVDVRELSENRAKWENLYASIVELAGGSVIEE